MSAPDSGNGNKIRLNLGCGQTPLPGFVNVDLVARPGVDLALDLEQTPWPWSDNAVDYILLSYVLEHISRFEAVWSEVYRVLKVGGKVEVRVVHGMSYDPFHTRYFKRASVSHLTNGYLGRFRLVGKVRMEPLRTGFPYWHVKHHLGLDLPFLSIPKGMAFTLEKIAD